MVAMTCREKSATSSLEDHNSEERKRHDLGTRESILD